MTDKYINYEEKFEVVKDKSIKLYNFMNDKIYNPLKENIIIIYDKSTQYISLMVKLIRDNIYEQQTRIIDYVRKNYENV